MRCEEQVGWKLNSGAISSLTRICRQEVKDSSSISNENDDHDEVSQLEKSATLSECHSEVDLLRATESLDEAP